MDENKEKLDSVSATQSSNNPELEQAQALTELQNQVVELKKQNKDLQEAKSKFYDSILNGATQVQVAEPRHRSVKEIREDMVKGFQNNITNLDYCKLAVELDDTVRAEAEKHGKIDSAFLPKGSDVQPSVDEYATADKMNSVLKECIQLANGDADRFNLELKAHMAKR